MRYLSYIYLLSFVSFTSYALSDSLNLIVGNEGFKNIDRAILLKHPSRLKTQLSTTDEEGYYKIDGDAALFPQILDFMKYDIIRLKTKNPHNRQQERLILFHEAEKFSLTAMKNTLAWDIFSNTQNLADLPTIIWQNMPNIDIKIAQLRNKAGELRFFLLCYHPGKVQPIIIGSKNFGCTIKKSCKKSLYYRKGNIIISWSGKISLPYNIALNKMIGEEPKKIHDDFDAKPLLEHIIDDRYLCSRLANGNYAIYDAVSAERVSIRSSIEYSNLDECVNDLYELFGQTKMAI